MMAIFSKWKEKIVEPLEDWQEKARQQWLSLNPRERLILSGLASVMTLLLMALFIKEATGFFFRQTSMAENNFKNIERIQRLSDELLQQKVEISRYDALKEKRGEDFKLSSYIEAEAARVGISITKMAPTKVKSGKDSGEEDWVEVQLSRDTTLSPLLKFLAGVEQGLGVRIVELSVKPDFTNPSKLEVTAIIANSKNL
jgi:type II secretory pathway component PulM